MTRSDRIALIFGAGVLVLSVGIWRYPIPDDAKFLQVCETTLAKRLKAPSTYVRIAATGLKRAPADFVDYMGYETEEKRQYHTFLVINSTTMVLEDEARETLFNSGKFERAFVEIDYDSENAFGAPIRNKATCQQIVPMGQEVEIDKISQTTVDGFSSLDWPRFMLWKQGRPSN